jgi:hypothetical protein
MDDLRENFSWETIQKIAIIRMFCYLYFEVGRFTGKQKRTQQ